MTKIKSHKFRICRQVGDNLWNVEKIKYKTDKTPGEHGKKHKKTTDNRYEPLYSTQLREKQKLKKYYSNLGEKKFRSYFDKGLQIKGPLTANFLTLLERRLDTIIYRAGFCTSMQSARQLISHGHISVNRVRVTRPSFSVSNGDLIVSSFDKPLDIVHPDSPSYLEVNRFKKTCILVRDPYLPEIPTADKFSIKSIIEFYSR